MGALQRPISVGDWTALSVDSMLNIQNRLAKTPLRTVFPIGCFGLFVPISNILQQGSHGFQTSKVPAVRYSARSLFHLSILSHLFPDEIDNKWIDVLDEIGRYVWLHGPRRTNETLAPENLEGLRFQTDAPRYFEIASSGEHNNTGPGNPIRIP